MTEGTVTLSQPNGDDRMVEFPPGVMGAGGFYPGRAASRRILCSLDMSDLLFTQFPEFAKSTFNSLIHLI